MEPSVIFHTFGAMVWITGTYIFCWFVEEILGGFFPELFATPNGYR